MLRIAQVRPCMHRRRLYEFDFHRSLASTTEETER
jgi:hypothetical protein